jgi:hypothetical protein
MPDRNSERELRVRFSEDLHRRLGIRCAEFDATIQDLVVDLLERNLSSGSSGPRSVIRPEHPAPKECDR